MAKILPFAPQTNQKFGFERVKKRRIKRKQDQRQLDLFATPQGKILQFPQKRSLFEKALLLDEQDPQKATEYYWKAISSGESVDDAYCNLGIIESKANRITKAFDCFTKSLKHNPRHFESHYNLANLYIDMENIHLARIHYELAKEIKPDFPNLYFNLGLVYAIQENFPKAIESLITYKDLVPKQERFKADELLSNLEEMNVVKN